MLLLPLQPSAEDFKVGGAVRDGGRDTGLGE